ncbi:GntR family transcriptional regulator [Sedimentitalea sp. HM32M-2]|uniref:GntR family transcriptional regulator n=1 Tax=Sedimentitalea sp. HM32M-2 TaxID=3351566 RepID=UPI00363F5C35
MTQTTAQAAEAEQKKARPPAHEHVYQKLRAQILFGEIAPGQAVTIQGLTTALGAGMTPVREAIRRLISEGALMFQGNRRVSVPVLAAGDIEQITFIRKAMELELTRRAVTHIGADEIDQLKSIDNALDEAIEAGDVGTYLKRNYQFHSRLYARADAPIMAAVADRLWLQFGPSLRVVCGRYGTHSLQDHHKDLLVALQAQDADLAGRSVILDIEDGMRQIAADLKGGD